MKSIYQNYLATIVFSNVAEILVYSFLCGK